MSKKFMTVTATSMPFGIPAIDPSNLGYVGSNVDLYFEVELYPNTSGKGKIFTTNTLVPYFKNFTIEQFKVEISGLQGARFGQRVITSAPNPQNRVGYFNQFVLDYQDGYIPITLDQINEWQELNQTVQLDAPRPLSVLNFDKTILCGQDGSSISDQFDCNITSLGANIDFRNVQQIYQNTKQYLKFDLKISYQDVIYMPDGFGNP